MSKTKINYLKEVTKNKYYVLMLILFGITVGFISALSKTSVSNVVLQLFVGMLASGAGIHFLGLKTESDRSKLELLGLSGLLLLISYWIAFSLMRTYLVDRTNSLYQSVQTIDDKVILYQIEAHIKNLGIPKEQYHDTLTSYLTTATNNSCQVRTPYTSIKFGQHLFKRLTECPALKPYHFTLTELYKSYDDIIDQSLSKSLQYGVAQKLNYLNTLQRNFTQSENLESLSSLVQACTTMNNDEKSHYNILATYLQKNDCKEEPIQRLNEIVNKAAQSYKNSWEKAAPATEIGVQEHTPD